MKRKLTIMLLKSFGFRDRAEIVSEALEDLGTMGRQTFLNCLMARALAGKHIHTNPRRRKEAI